MGICFSDGRSSHRKNDRSSWSDPRVSRGANVRRRSSSLSPSAPSFSSKDSLNSSIRSACLHSNRSHWKIELANAELENFQMDPQKINEIKMLRRASRASNTEHLKRQYSHNQSLTSDELQKTSTRELLGDSHSKLSSEKSFHQNRERKESLCVPNQFGSPTHSTTKSLKDDESTLSRSSDHGTTMERRASFSSRRGSKCSRRGSTVINFDPREMPNVQTAKQNLKSSKPTKSSLRRPSIAIDNKIITDYDKLVAELK
jgi:hypothetical protein